MTRATEGDLTTKLQRLFLASMQRILWTWRLSKFSPYFTGLLIFTFLALIAGERTHWFGPAWQSEVASGGAGLRGPNPEPRLTTWWAAPWETNCAPLMIISPESSPSL